MDGTSDSNRALTSGAPSHPRVVFLEHYYGRVASLPVERRTQALDVIGCAYLDTYMETNKIEDLERAISILGEALQNASSDPELPEYLNNLTACLLKRIERTGSLDDIENAISRSQDAIDITKTGDPNRYLYIINHATALLERFKCIGKLEDLQRSISVMNMAEGLVPDGHPGRSAYFSNLGKAFETQFDRLDRVEDLEAAISHKQKAVDLTPDDHPAKPIYLNNLGNAFEARSRRLGRVEDLEAAIAHKQKALDLIPDGHLRKPVYLNNLGGAFKTRFDRLGHVKDLELAILHNQNAVDLALDGHPEKPGYLSDLGNAFRTRFDRLGHVEDLERAILHTQKAVNLTPDGHQAKSNRLSNLGTAFVTRFDRLGRVGDLEAAIIHKQKAVDLTPDGHPDKPGRLSNLGGAFEIRFTRIGRVEDLERAIMHIQKAVNLTPDGHPDKTIRLYNLGNAFKIRFNQLDRVEDLERAIVHTQMAVNLTPDDHPAKPIRLSNLGIDFERRFYRLRHVEDLETAVAHTQKAVELTPDGHPAKPLRLANVGTVFKTRFDRLGGVEYLERAVTHNRNAVELTPDGHPGKPEYLNNLGIVLKTRFLQLGHIEDLETALIQYSTAASLPTASPRIRLWAARAWADASKILQMSGVLTLSPLEPYHVALDLLPRVAWLGIPISTQHALLEEVGGTAREAVAAAIKEEQYETAVEWAEAGRSIAWQNLLNLRTPVDELRNVHYDLADRLETISRQLDMSVRGSDGAMNGATDEMEEDSRSHVQLALDWDNTVTDIRSRSGFETFLKPKSFNQLGRIARDGPVVILNISEDRCDALILFPEDGGDIHISHIPLGGFSYAKGEALLKELKGLLSSKHLRARDTRKPRRMPIDDGNGPPLEHVLRHLWLDVVKPIVDALAYQTFRGIWWCATGPLAFLPIHAAGIYDTDELGSKLSDYVVSSYTPTLSALLGDSNPSQEDFRLLAIAQANAPGTSSIPETEVEVKKIQTLAKNINITTMKKEDATVENVWRGMGNSNWVHLACHGQQNIKEPMKSGLLLHDGTLELQRLIKKPLPLADFAFLSACQTATGDESVAEESLHLAAGMLFAGYKGVIATMWSIMDDVGPRVAEDVYLEMLKDGKPNRKAAAHALHNAVRRLREDPKVDMLHWVPFIHIGL